MVKLLTHENLYSPFPRMGEGLGLGADHLGNVRDVITTDPAYSNSNTEITDYYPFGQEIPLSGSTDNQIKYNSKELLHFPLILTTTFRS